MPGLVLSDPAALGFSIPPNEQHATSVSLPTWLDCTDYERGHARVVDAMQIGYPRFFVNKIITKLADHCIKLLGQPDEMCYLFPTATVAADCQDFLKKREPSVASRVDHLPIPGADESLDIHPVFLKLADASIGKQFWQHTGDGVSSRYAARCLSALEASSAPASKARNPLSSRGFARNKHYAKSSVSDILPPKKEEELSSSLSSIDNEVEKEDDPLRYVEERYGRNLARRLAPLAKVALRRRIAGVLKDSHAEHLSPDDDYVQSPASLDIQHEEASLNHSASATASTSKHDTRISGIAEEDVYLYSTGMSAIYHAHRLAMQHCQDQGKRVGKSVCFGFPYTDTLKILQKWGPGCYHFGNGLEEDLDAFEIMLEKRKDEDEPPILSVFTEFPSNPLLRSCNLPRLRSLADKYGFLLVVDETIGTFVNVEVLPMCDIVVSSLTKVFSGDGNVMGGSLILNPNLPYYSTLKKSLRNMFQDNFFDEDALFLERNSRNFEARVRKINSNAEQVCDYLREQAGPSSALKTVYYPKFITPENYKTCMRASANDSAGQAGYGGLFSLTFSDLEASERFYDHLQCAKGPSLGTNFTLACPYTVLAHWTELDWAGKWGVEENLVRVSVGLEDVDQLKQWFAHALKHANCT